MSQLKILLDQVSLAANGIRTAMQNMEQIAVDRIVGPDGQYGHEGVHDALEEFGERWQRGVSALLEDGEALSDGLHGAVTSYAQTDKAFSDALGGRDPGGPR